MRTGLTISVGMHVAALIYGLVSISAKPFDTPPTDSMPVDIISESEFSQLRAGAKDAPKPEAPKPVVEKVDTPKPAEDLKAKVTEKQEVTASAAETPPPPPVEAKPEPKPEPKPAPQAKAEPQPNEPEPKQQPDKADPIAEALKKDEAKKPEEKKAEAKPPTPTPPKRPEPPKPVAQKPPQPQESKFDADKIAALLDKRAPQRHAAAGEVLNRTAALGSATGNAPQLSQSELDALRARLRSVWIVPVGAAAAETLRLEVRMRLKTDGTLAAPPEVLTSGSGPYFNAARESAVRAVFRGQPYDMLRPQTYETWKDIVVTFDPREMFGG